MWAGSDTVIVRVNHQDVVFHIEMRYSGGFDPSPLVQELSSKFGSGDALPGSFFWHNRTTTMFVSTPTARSMPLDTSASSRFLRQGEVISNLLRYGTRRHDRVVDAQILWKRKVSFRVQLVGCIRGQQAFAGSFYVTL